MSFSKIFRSPIFLVVIALFVLWLGFGLAGSQPVTEITTQKGIELLATEGDEAAKVTEVTIIGTENRVEMTLTAAAADAADLTEKVQFYYVTPRGEAVVAAVDAASLKDGYNDRVPTDPWWIQWIFPILMIGVIVAFYFFIFNSSRSGENRVMQFGKSRAKIVSKETPQVTFADVAGSDEAVEELEEIKDFLKDPTKFQALGARIPKGVLLYGPPGTGKTLLARAVAGEAGVPFFSISGSDFVEMFVGVGASRVRDLFEQAKQNSPAIIFVDEIDAVGRHRGAGMGGGHDEREQTLNQLLVEMDGFDVKTNVILIAATNRPDILDPALLRPGRFDRQIGVDAPDLKGREQILRIHGANKPLAEGVDLELVARRTPGFTGADLANVLNEAALLAARRGAESISDPDLDEAIDRVMAGPQRRTRVMNDREKLVTAYHEGGHAVVAAAMNHTDPVTKITILPRGRALGYTMVMPLEDKYSVTREELLDQLAYSLGGRVAEELVFHDPTSGAANDIEKATATARRMVTEYGMSSSVGMVKLGSSSGEVFLGRSMGHERDYSEAIATTVDGEVRALIENAHDEAWKVLSANRKVLDTLAKELLEKETLDQKQLAELFAKITKLPKRRQWLSSSSRPVSSIPPISIPSGLVPEPVDGRADGGGAPAPEPKPKRTRSTPPRPATA